ncbi:DUF418 domain-containing protein [Pseudoalteromonas rhizosphaerae]|uniref:DUF418 domain-containing protein n=1 Tax=Pseudoalteromonas rhizosphaerae TaxID=2518973 RepID=UPI00384FFD3B
MRNQNMDVIRGLAVLGLMYMNAYSFGLFEFGYVPLQSPPFSDHVIQWVSLSVIDGRFRSLFCLLFGAGLYIQWQRYQQVEQLQKRLKVLAVFGLLHGFLLWAGDILFIYACAGWLVIQYLDASDEMLLKRGWQFLSLAAAITFLIALVDPTLTIYRDSADFLASYNASQGSALTIFVNNSVMFIVMLIALPLITLWMAAGLMLFGIYGYKNKLFETGLTKLSKIRVLSIALLLSAIRISFEYQSSLFISALKEPVSWFAALLTALLIIHFVVMLMTKHDFHFIALQRAGRLALTLYLMQTICLLLLFKVFYPHWVLSFNHLEYYVLVSGLVIFQLSFSVIYSRYFKQGPMEFIWRKYANAA